MLLVEDFRGFFKLEYKDGEKIVIKNFKIYCLLTLFYIEAVQGQFGRLFVKY